MRPKPSNPIHVKAWQGAIAVIEPVNGPVELVPMTERGEPMPRARGRLFMVDKTTGVMTVEKVAGQRQAEALAKGIAVEVYVVVGQSRMKAESRVMDVGAYRLNADTRVMAVQLEPVWGIVPAQRRMSFRLPTTGLLMPPVRIVHAGLNEEKTTLSAMLLDISERGVGVSVKLDLAVAQKLMDKLVRVHIDLPDTPEPIEAEARVVRVFDTAIRNPTLGMQFEFSTIAEQRRVEGNILHFSAEQQRKQLRRVKRVG